MIPSLFISFGICLGLVLFCTTGRRTSRRDDITAVQAAHCRPTPRLGGIGIAAGLAVSAWLMRAELPIAYLLVLLSAVPILAVGISEDLGYHVAPRIRLGTAALCGIAAALALDIRIVRVDVPLVDAAMLLMPVGLLFTGFALAGMTHAFNIIDGINGLAGTIAILAAVGLALIAGEASVQTRLPPTALLIGAVTGFLLVNFPAGRIFLGDGGAYAIGYILAWMAILLMWVAPAVSPWAIVLVFFWPIADTLFAIYRRAQIGRRYDQPDRLHFHQFMLRGIEILYLGRSRRAIANPVATLCILPLAAAPVAAGVFFWDDPLVAFLLTCAFALLFVGTYRLGVRGLATRPRGLGGLVAAAATRARPGSSRPETDPV